ncbi:16S rRNA (guanine(966)-N(2))-methyltransferase RsmD [Bacteroidales bacterium]
MRIIRGRLQRRIIHVPPGLPVRPTTDLAKESLFNILENEIEFEGLKALDLFAGTGSISYELVSRGCQTVTAIDENLKCSQFIAETAKKLEMPNLRAIRSDVFRFLGTLSSPHGFIFADPPYEMETERFHEIVRLVFERTLLEPEGVLVIEHPKNVDFMGHPLLFDIRKYGKVHFSFFGLPVENDVG